MLKQKQHHARGGVSNKAVEAVEEAEAAGAVEAAAAVAAAEAAAVRASVKYQ